MVRFAYERAGALMSIFSKLLAFVFIFMLIACVLYVVFGQVTVRKLRKNSKTRDELGLQLVSGWDIINVAQALSFPESWSKKLRSEEHTSELQSRPHLVCRLLLEKKKKK